MRPIGKQIAVGAKTNILCCIGPNRFETNDMGIKFPHSLRGLLQHLIDINMMLKSDEFSDFCKKLPKDSLFHMVYDIRDTVADSVLRDTLPDNIKHVSRFHNTQTFKPIVEGVSKSQLRLRNIESLTKFVPDEKTFKEKF